MAGKSELRLFIDEELAYVFKDIAESTNHSPNILAQYIIAKYIIHEKPVYEKQFEKYLDFSKQSNLFEDDQSAEDFSSDEMNLVRGYRRLDNGGQNVVWQMIDQLSRAVERTPATV